MTDCLVLDIETKIDRVALGASGRTSAPTNMPPPLQVVTATAMLEFNRDDHGIVSDFRLTSCQVDPSGESGPLVSTEQTLARLHTRKGELITFNGQHDLSILRFALLRARILGGCGVRNWMGATAEAHRDLMHEVAGRSRWSRLDDVAAGLGFAGPTFLGRKCEAGVARAKAERDVVLTALLCLHLDAERQGDVARFAQNLLVIGRFLGSRALSVPHLGNLLLSPLYASASNTLAMKRTTAQI